MPAEAAWLRRCHSGQDRLICVMTNEAVVETSPEFAKLWEAGADQGAGRPCAFVIGGQIGIDLRRLRREGRSRLVIARWVLAAYDGMRVRLDRTLYRGPLFLSGGTVTTASSAPSALLDRTFLISLPQPGLRFGVPNCRLRVVPVARLIAGQRPCQWLFIYMGVGSARGSPAGCRRSSKCASV